MVNDFPEFGGRVFEEGEVFDGEGLVGEVIFKFT